MRYPEKIRDIYRQAEDVAKDGRTKYQQNNW